jgi:DNA invertase Pin-like site-specific DNA recombinase
MPNAVAYIRVSDQRQVDDGSSLQTQERVVRGYADARGLTFERLFVEEGESAKTDARPQLAKMLQFCRASSGVDVLIVPKIDRLARNAFDYAKIKLELEVSGVKIESVGERIEDSPVGRFTESILASAAQFENEVRAERSKGGMIEAVSTGRWVWRAPRGYRNIRVDGKGTIEPRSDEADLITEAFRRLASGTYSPSSVHHWLRGQGFAVTRSAFYRLIRNPVYLGEMHVFGSVYRGSDPFVPLVSDATFERARQALVVSARPIHYASQRDDFPLRGLVACTCGQNLTASWSKGRSRSYAYYRCMQCTGVNLNADMLHSDVEAILARYTFKAGVWDRLKVALLAWEGGREERMQALTLKNRDEIQSRESLVRSISLKNAGGVIPDDIAREEIARLTAEIRTLMADQPQERPNANDDLPTVLEFAQHFLQDLASHWRSASVNKKRQLVSYLFPDGLCYEKSVGFRTADCKLLELLCDLSSCRVSRLVDPNHDTTNLCASPQSLRECDLVDPSPDVSNQLVQWLNGFVEILSESGLSDK